MSPLFIAAGLLPALFLAGFAVTSMMEGEKRAAAVALALTLVFSALWIATGSLLRGHTNVVAGVFWGAAAAAIAFLLLPLGRKEPLEICESPAERIDERDIMFSRMNLDEGSEHYARYYGELRPELEETDRKLRALPPLYRPGGKFHSAAWMSCAEVLFDIIEELRAFSAPAPEAGSRSPGLDPVEAARRIKWLARRMGAADARITKLRPRHMYSHAGRRAESWGEEIAPEHEYAVVFSVEMEHRAMREAPKAPVLTESALRYLVSAVMAVKIAEYCAHLGHEARAHFDANYQVLVPAVAHDAGLGELGRLGLLVTPRLGPRVRLAAVTTNLPLAVDERREFGVQDFCSFCRKCARCCPGGAIAGGERTRVGTALKWQSSQEACYRVWRKLGTDCGICLAVCPYAKPDTFYHKIVRFFCVRSAPSRRLALHLDDLFYGRKPRSARA